AYRIRDDTIERLTGDHSLLEEFRRARRRVRPAHRPRFAAVLTRVLGLEPEVAIELAQSEVAPGDRYVLGSDALWRVLDDARLRDIVRACGSLQRAAERLLESARRAGSADDIGVILIECAALH